MEDDPVWNIFYAMIWKHFSMKQGKTIGPKSQGFTRAPKVAIDP